MEEAWKEARDANTRLRLNWRNLIGKSLEEFVAERKARGITDKGVIIKDACMAMQGKKLYLPDYEIAKRLEIGVGARLAEFGIMERVSRKRNISERNPYETIVRNVTLDSGEQVSIVTVSDDLVGKKVEIRLRVIE